MKLLHIGVAALNLLCLSALVGDLCFDPGGSVGYGLFAFALLGGSYANLPALVVVAAIVVVALVFGAFSGQAASTLRGHSLGNVNGVAVVVW